jgi:hypothetical protein
MANMLGEGYLDPPPRGEGGVRNLLGLLRIGNTPYIEARGLFGGPAGVPGGTTPPSVGPPPGGPAFMGVEVFRARETVGGPVQYWVVAVPAAYLVLAAAMLPAIWFARRLAGRRRALAGHCPHCGYDLRATPGRCPECGGVPAHSSS